MTTTKRSGRPATMLKCPICQEPFTITELRAHLGKCYRDHYKPQKEEEKPQ